MSPAKSGDIVKIDADIVKIGQTPVTVKVVADNRITAEKLFESTAVLVNIKDEKKAPFRGGVLLSGLPTCDVYAGYLRRTIGCSLLLPMSLSNSFKNATFLPLFLFLVGSINLYGDMFHAVKGDNGWDITNVAQTPPISTYTFNAAAIDFNNNIAFVYHEYSVIENEYGIGHGDSGSLKYAEYSNGSWNVITIDNNGNTGFNNSLAFDSLGNPHVVYVNHTDDTLRYATRTNGAWAYQVLDNLGPYTSYPDGQTSSPQKSSATSLVIDKSTNTPTIAYLHQSTHTVKYGVLENGEFKTTDVAMTAGGRASYASEGRYVAHALDSSGNPHIGYWSANSDQVGVNYATLNDEGEWVYSSVTGHYNSWYLSMGLDSEDSPHFAVYQEVSDMGNRIGLLNHFYFDGELWATELIDAPEGEGAINYMGWHPSLVFDADGTAHVSYADIHGQAIKYAVYKNGEWISEVVDSGAYMIGLMSALVLDENGVPHIVYDPPVTPIPEPSTIALLSFAGFFFLRRRIHRSWSCLA